MLHEEMSGYQWQSCWTSYLLSKIENIKIDIIHISYVIEVSVVHGDHGLMSFRESSFAGFGIKQRLRELFGTRTCNFNQRRRKS